MMAGAMSGWLMGLAKLVANKANTITNNFLIVQTVVIRYEMLCVVTLYLCNVVLLLLNDVPVKQNAQDAASFNTRYNVNWSHIITGLKLCHRRLAV